MGSWGKIGGEGSVGEVGIGEGGESGGGDDGSGLDTCGWLGVRKVGSKDLRCMDKGNHLADGMPGGLEGEGSGGGETELGWF